MALQIEVGTDNSGLERGISDVERQLRTLERRREARVRIGADVGDLDRRISETTANLTRLRNSLNQTSNATTNLTRQTANGNNALTQFNRIVQDAPFGAMGVQNNLTAFGEAFGHLVTQTGSARTAFSAMVGSLTGIGGVMLAVSAVTSAMTYMSQKGLTVSDVMNMITGDFNEARHAMQQLNIEAAKNAQGDISGMNAYVAVAKDVNLSMEDRLIAVKKLQDEYPAYFGNLTKEQILNGNVASTVKEVTAALIARAKATALTERIVKLATEEEELRIKINNQILEAARSSKLTNAQTAILAGNFKALAENGGNFMDTVNKVGKEANIPWLVLNGTIVRVLQGFTDLGSELRNNKAQQDRLTSSLEKQTAAQIKLEDVKDKAVKTKARIKIEAVPELTPVKSTDDQNDKLLKIMRDSLSEDITNLKTVPIKLDIPIQPVTDTRAAARALIPYYKMFFEFTQSVDELVTSSMQSTFENIGTTIGEALSQGKNVFGAIGKSLIASLGAFLSEMGSLLIKYGTLAVAKGVIDKALTSGNPVVTIAAGAAAIAVGVALKAAGGTISTKASGNGNSLPSTGAGYSSPASRSSVSGGNSSFSNGSVVFEISGSSLIGVLRNTYDQNLRLGGANGL